MLLFKIRGGFRWKIIQSQNRPLIVLYVSRFCTMAGAAIPIPTAGPIIGTGFGVVFDVILERGIDPLKNNAKGLVGL